MADETQCFSPGVPLRPTRVTISLPVRYRLMGEDHWHAGRTENISQAGVLIRGARLFAQHSAVEVTLTLPPGLLPDVSGEALFVGTVARLVKPAWSGAPPGFGVAFQLCRKVEDPGKPAATQGE